MWDPHEPTSARYEYGVARSAPRRSFERAARSCSEATAKIVPERAGGFLLRL